MKSQAVLLSQHAQMNAKPELEIFADDVVCGHGATVGSLDPEQLFLHAWREASREAKPKRCCWRPLATKRSAVSKTTFWRTALRLPSRAWLARSGARIDGKARGWSLLMNDVVERPGRLRCRERSAGISRSSRERPYGKSLVYLDNAASAQKPKAVIDRLVHAYEHEYANVHRGLHYLANAATEAYEAARETVRRFLNAGSTDEIIFTRSATEAINLVAASFGLSHIGAGRRDRAQRDGASLQHRALAFPSRAQGRGIALGRRRRRRLFLARRVREGADERTKIVAITQMSNVLGNGAADQGDHRIAHARGIPVLVDGSQGAVHLDVDVRDLDADFYVVHRP